MDRALAEAMTKRDDALLGSEATLREREERYRLIVAGALDYAILTTDPSGIIDSWSPGAEAVLGWTAEQAIGQPIDITFTPEDRGRGIPAKERSVARRDGVGSDVRWHLRKDGRRVFIDGSIRLLTDGDGERGFLKIGQDVTERRRTEQALRASEERFRTLVQNIRDYAIFMLDADGVITQWTDGAQRMMGYSAEEAVGLHLAVFYTPDQIEQRLPWQELATAARDGRVECEGWRVRRDGDRIWVNEIATAFRYADGTLAGFTKIDRDLTEQRRADEALRQSRRGLVELNESLERRVAERTAELAESNDALRREIRERETAEASRREVLRQLIGTEEDERRRLSRELHDHMGQQVTALLLGLGALARDATNPDRQARIRSMEQLAGEITREIQSLALELRPPALDSLGLEIALRGHLDEWSSRHGIPADFHAIGLDAAPMPADVQATIYRIVQEGLTNILKHARASHASLVLERRDDIISAILEDDGVGFDAERALTASQRSLGLRNMRERVALLGGELEIESSPEAGTALYVRLPASAAKAPEAGTEFAVVDDT
jgi:PAS domain S-box-containing protein